MSLWRQYSSQALVGLDQSQTAVALTANSPLETTLSQARASAPSPQESFLDELSVLASWRRCGKTAIKAGPLPDAPPPEDRTPCPPEARNCLIEILDTAYSEPFLIEWLQLADRSQRLIPPELLPKLMTRAATRASLAKLVFETGGKRALLLAKQNEKWAALLKPDPKQAWEEGQPAERLVALEQLLTSSRETALALIAESWKSESAAFRAKVVDLVGANASMESESFLEAALSDKSQEVRANATLALARIHRSSIAKRWAEEAAKLLVFKPPGLLSKGGFDFELPSDSFLSECKIETKPLTKSARLGEKAATLAVLVAATPVSAWLERTKLTPAKLIALADRSDHSLAILSGLALSAAVAADRETAKALFTQPRPFDLLLGHDGLLAYFPTDSAQRLAAELFDSGQLHPYPVKSGRSLNANTLSAPWSTELTQATLRSFSKLVRSEEPYWGAKDLVTSYAPVLETKTAIRAVGAWTPSPVWSDAVALLLDQLRFRERLAASFSANANR